MNGPYVRSAATRERLLDLIRGQPGIGRGELARQAGLSWSAVSHHVRGFCRRGDVACLRVGHRVLYHAGPAPPQAVALRRALRTEPQASRLLRHLNDGPVSMRQVSQALGVDRKSVRRHLRLLAGAGLVGRGDGPRPRFELKAIPLDLRDHFLR